MDPQTLGERNILKIMIRGEGDPNMTGLKGNFDGQMYWDVIGNTKYFWDEETGQWIKEGSSGIEFVKSYDNFVPSRILFDNLNIMPGEHYLIKGSVGMSSVNPDAWLRLYINGDYTDNYYTVGGLIVKDSEGSETVVETFGPGKYSEGLGLFKGASSLCFTDFDIDIYLYHNAMGDSFFSSSFTIRSSTEPRSSPFFELRSALLSEGGCKRQISANEITSIELRWEADTNQFDGECLLRLYKYKL